MTDHNAEGGKVVEACGFCHETPEVASKAHGVRYLSDVCNCFPFHNQEMRVESWNDMQQRILAQRRKDFESGQESVSREYGGGLDWTFDEYIKDFKP